MGWIVFKVSSDIPPGVVSLFWMICIRFAYLNDACLKGERVPPTGTRVPPTIPIPLAHWLTLSLLESPNGWKLRPERSLGRWVWPLCSSLLEAGWGKTLVEGTPALILFALKGPNRKAKWCGNSLKLPMATIGCVEGSP